MFPLSRKEEDDVSRYCDNQLNATERATFEKAMHNSEALRKALAIEMKLRSTADSAAHKIKKHLQPSQQDDNKEIAALISQSVAAWEIERQLTTANEGASQKPAAVISMRNLKRVAVAAVIGGIIIVSAIFFITQKNETPVAINKPDEIPSKAIIDTGNRSSSATHVTQHEPDRKLLEQQKLDKLFAQNFSPAPAPVSIPDVLEEPLAYYEAKQYSNAITAFGHVDITNAGRGGGGSDQTTSGLASFYVFYYKGIALLMTGNTANALKELKLAVAQNPSGALIVYANWYLALAYLKAGNVNAAKPLLQQVAGTGLAPYKAKAVAILEQMP